MVISSRATISRKMGYKVPPSKCERAPMMAPSILGYMLRNNGMDTSENSKIAFKHFANIRRFYAASTKGNLQGIHHQMESANWTRPTLLYGPCTCVEEAGGEEQPARQGDCVSATCTLSHFITSCIKFRHSMRSFHDTHLGTHDSFSGSFPLELGLRQTDRAKGDLMLRLTIHSMYIFPLMRRC